MLFFLFGWKVKCLPVNICLIVFLLLHSSLYLRKNVKFLHKLYVMEYDFNSFKHYIFTGPHFASGRDGVWEYGDEWVKCTNGTTTATITKKKKKLKNDLTLYFPPFGAAGADLLYTIISFVDNPKPYTNSLHFHYATSFQTLFK